MEKESRIRVLLADAKNNVGFALRSVLEREPDMELIGEAEDVAASVRLTSVLKPDVVAMVLDMFDQEGMEITRQIIAANPDVKVLAISPYYDNWCVVRAMLRCGYMLTDCAFEDLARAVRAAASSHVHASPGTAGMAMEMPRQ